MQIGFIGLGQMGEPMARNLLKAGHTLTVWNRSPEKAKALTAEGAKLAASPAEAARGEAVITMLADDAAVEAVTFGKDGILAALGQKSVHLSMSTIGVAFADRLAEAHAKHGSGYLSVPVFGRPPAAAAAKLFVVAGGAPETIARVQPLLDAIGQRTFRAGEIPSTANVIKLCGNFMIMSAIETMAEALALAAKSGVKKESFLEVMTETLFAAPVYKTYGEILAKEQFRPAGFAAPLGLKDMRHVLAAAETRRVPMPFGSVVRDHLLELIATEGEDIDWAGLGLVVGRNAGL